MSNIENTIIEDLTYGGTLGMAELKNDVWIITYGTSKELDGFQEFPKERFADIAQVTTDLNTYFNDTSKPL